MFSADFDKAGLLFWRENLGEIIWIGRQVRVAQSNLEFPISAIKIESKSKSGYIIHSLFKEHSFQINTYDILLSMKLGWLIGSFY